jgi:uncharacterized membrane protein YccC
MFCSSFQARRYGTLLKLGATLFILSAPLAAEAYVGPGAGLSLLSALWGLLCAIGAAFLFVILWPIRRWRRKRREARQAHKATSSAASQARQHSPETRESHSSEDG